MGQRATTKPLRVTQSLFSRCRLARLCDMRDRWPVHIDHSRGMSFAHHQACTSRGVASAVELCGHAWWDSVQLRYCPDDLIDLGVR